jgi:hypothetical protein
MPVVFNGATNGEGWTLNLSSGGIRILTTRFLSVDDVLQLQPGEAEGAAFYTGRWCRVVWVKRYRDGFVAGMVFTDLSRSPPADSPSADDAL